MYRNIFEIFEFGSSRGESRACINVFINTARIINQSNIYESFIINFDVIIYPLTISILDNEIPLILFSYSSDFLVIKRKSAGVSRFSVLKTIVNSHYQNDDHELNIKSDEFFI